MEKDNDIMELIDKLGEAVNGLTSDMEKYNKKIHEGVEQAIKEPITIKSSLGHIYIGDICYVMDDEIYDKFWGDEHNYIDGVFTYNGVKFGVYSTAYGDGCYRGSDNRSYGVDAGVIGVVPMELWKKDMTIQEANGCGRVVDISQVDFMATGRGNTSRKTDGMFYITIGEEQLEINTNDYDDDEYDY